LIFALGFLSLVNLILSVTTSDEKVSRSDDDIVADVETAEAIPEARMLNLATTVFDAIQTLEEKYYSR